MSEEKKPDGWVVWSEAGGFWARLDQEGWEVLIVYPADVYDKEHLAGHKGVRLNKGQRIRPVKLVFLDEEPK